MNVGVTLLMEVNWLIRVIGFCAFCLSVSFGDYLFFSCQAVHHLWCYVLACSMNLRIVLELNLGGQPILLLLFGLAIRPVE